MPDVTEKKIVPVSGKIGPQVNRYYRKISKRYRAIGALLMAVLILYIALIIMFFGEYITYDNLKYLARDLGSVSSLSGDGFTKIVFNGGNEIDFQGFRGGLSVSDTDSYQYYDSAGILLVDEAVSYADAQMVASEKYLLLYDLGGTGYSVFNQLTCVIEREADGKLIAADIAGGGEMILVMRSRETRFVVEYYNSTFKKTMNIYKDNYVMDAAISPNGDHIVICSAVSSDTDFDCEIDICAAGETKSRAVINYAHTMPLDVYGVDDGFVLLCDNGIYFYGYDGVKKSEFKFSGMTLKYADMKDNKVVVVGGVNALGTENRVIAIDTAGNTLYDQTVSRDITGIYASPYESDAICYLKNADSVTMITPSGEQNFKPESGEIVKAIPTEHGAILCQKTSAYPIFTKEKTVE